MIRYSYILHTIHEIMDKHIDQNAELLQASASQWDLHTLWRTNAKSIERGISDATETDQWEKQQFNGHGKPNVRVVKVPRKL